MSKIQSHSTDNHSDDCMSLSVSVVSQRHGAQSQSQRQATVACPIKSSLNVHNLRSIPISVSVNYYINSGFFNGIVLTCILITN